MANKIFFSQLFSFSHNKYQSRGNNRKIKCKHNFNNSQWQDSFFQSKDYLEQVTTGCGIV